jgi:hypothetical protein
MIVAHVVRQEPLQMALVQRDHMIQQIPSTAPDPPFCHAILPGAAEGCASRLTAHRLRSNHDLTTELRVAVEDQVLVCGFVGKGFTQLLYDPDAGWAARHIDMQDSPTIMGNDEEALKHSKRERRDREEVHRGNHFAVVPQEGQPTFRWLWVFRGMLHPTRDSPFRYIKAQHLQFTMNARRAPSGVLGNHLEDELS